MANLSEVDGKSALGSVGVWGSLLGIGASVVGMVSQVLGDPAIVAVLPANVVPYVTAVGAFIALMGRIRAKKQITGVIVPK